MSVVLKYLFFRGVCCFEVSVVFRVSVVECVCFSVCTEVLVSFFQFKFHMLPKGENKDFRLV